MTNNYNSREEGEWERMIREAEPTPSFSDEQSKRILERIRAEIEQPGLSPGQVKSLTRKSVGQEGRVMVFVRWLLAGKRGWATSVVVVAAVVWFVMGRGLWDDGSGGAYAAAVEQLRRARTMTYKITISPVMRGMPPMTVEMLYKEPGLLRMNMQMGIVGVFDIIEKKGITIMATTKQFVEENLSTLSADQLQARTSYFDDMRTLPDRADEVLGEKEMDGRTVRGFRVAQGDLDGLDKTLWVDAETGDLVRIEGEFANARGLHATMTDFRFDVDLPDSLFSLTPPEGYSPLNVQVDSSAPDEEDLVEYLRSFAGYHKDDLFPPSLHPVEIATYTMRLTREGKLRDREKGMTKDERFQKTLDMTRGGMFVLQMRPENDWHYAGEGVRLGDADTPICWYRPTPKSDESESADFQVWRPGSEIYRVIYGDLSIRDVAPEDLPSTGSSTPTPEGYTPQKATIKAKDSLPTEENLVTTLRWLAEHHKDGLFPPTFDPVGIRKYLEKAEREGKVIKSPKSGMSKEALAERARAAAKKAQEELSPGLRFAMFMKPANDFHYQGANGKLGEADKPICWWRPDGSETYRVVYADLSVHDVSPEDLPSIE